MNSVALEHEIKRWRDVIFKIKGFSGLKFYSNLFLATIHKIVILILKNIDFWSFFILFCFLLDAKVEPFLQKIYNTSIINSCQNCFLDKCINKLKNIMNLTNFLCKIFNSTKIIYRFCYNEIFSIILLIPVCAEKFFLQNQKINLH